MDIKGSKRKLMIRHVMSLQKSISLVMNVSLSSIFKCMSGFESDVFSILLFKYFVDAMCKFVTVTSTLNGAFKTRLEWNRCLN